jgi:tRNA nucleotidyltransferase (CCA-adding enzyme)
MKIYLVGGAVRDELLALPVADRDWVVTGTSAEAMQELGYRQVGKDFPVFLHPVTHEEYALARTERKTSAGYHGFAFDTSQSVSLEDDLARRDLTINAMARDETGALIDPWNGKRDLDQRILRHVSPAFAEDPLRVLRVARFSAKLAKFGFRIADETMDLMKQLSQSGELQTLAVERVFAEIKTSLGYNDPEPFFLTLRDCSALRVLWPELDQLFGVPQVPEYHPEIDSGLHTLMTLRQTCRLTDSTVARFAALCHDLGKGTTPEELLPHHYAHEERGAEITESLAKRWKLPQAFRDLAVMTARYHTHTHRALELRPGKLLKLLQAVDCLRKPDRFELFLLVCEADARGRAGLESRDYAQADYLRGAAGILKSVDSGAIAQLAKERKTDIPEAIRTERLRALKAYRLSQSA